MGTLVGGRLALEFNLNWTDLGWFVAGAVNLVCLVWVLRAAPPSPLRRGFALLMALSGGAILFFLWWVEGEKRYLVFEMFDNAMVFGSLAILVAWLAIERGQRVAPWFYPATVVGLVVLTVAFAARPEWRMVADADHAVVGWGPLFPITEAVEIGLNTALALLLLSAGLRRNDAILVMAALGFASWAMLGGIHNLPYVLTGVDQAWWSNVPEGDRAWLLVIYLPPVATAAYTLGAFPYILARRPRNRSHRVATWGFVAVAGTGVVLSTIAFLNRAGELTAYDGVLRIATGLSSLLIPFFGTLYLVAQANVTRESRVWQAVRRSSVPATMVAVFFVVSEGAQTFFAGALGPLIGLLATLPIVLLLVPIQRLGERVGHAVAPEARTQGASDKEDIYQRQVRFAWTDGRIGSIERERLVDLRKALGIAAERAEELEVTAIKAKTQ